MKPQEIKDLLEVISKLDLKEVRIKDKDFEIRVRTDKDENVVYSTAQAPMMSAPMQMTSAPQQAASVPAAPASTDVPATPASTEGSYLEVKSPMVGTFYRSPSPEKGPYIQVGDSISSGDVVCIIEAMKLFNEIESEIGGKIVKICVDDSSPVEYDQVLFLVDPKG